PTPESDVETDDEVDDVELSDEDATACDENDNDNDNDNDEAPSILSEGNDSIETDTEDTSCLPFAEELGVLTPSGTLFTQRPAQQPAIFGWWRDQQIASKLATRGTESFDSLVLEPIAALCDQRGDEPVAIWSLSGGDPEFELRLAHRLIERGHTNFEIDCIDDRISWHAVRAAIAEDGPIGERIHSLPASQSSLSDDKQYDAFIANGSLEQVADLPGMITWIKAAFKQDSILLLGASLGSCAAQANSDQVETVGRIWSVMPDRYMHNHLTGVLQSDFEGTAAADDGVATAGPLSPNTTPLLALLVEAFSFEVFAPFGNLINAFVGPEIGPNFDPGSETDRSFIERFAALDEAQIDSGTIVPIHLTAIARSTPVQDALILENRSPERCLLNDEL
ncbi:MAG: hypothetical protein ACI8W3_002536, partial [Myxococcota bacterium]